MIAIRTYSKPLKKVVAREEDLVETTPGEAVKQPKKKLLKVDKKLLNNPFSSSDDDDSDIDYEELQNSSIFFQSDQYLFQSSYMPDLAAFSHNNTSSNNPGNSTKRSIKAPESLKSPLAEWSEPVEDWRALVTEDILSESGRSPSMRNLDRRHTLNLADTITANLAALNIFRNGKQQRQKGNQAPSHEKDVDGHADFGFVGIQELVQVSGQ